MCRLVFTPGKGVGNLSYGGLGTVYPASSSVRAHDTKEPSIVVALRRLSATRFTKVNDGKSDVALSNAMKFMSAAGWGAVCKTKRH